MTKTLSGLQSGEFGDIDVFHTITINGEAGANNQVLTSDGDETSWKDVTIANNSVGPNQLADDAVTADKLVANSVGREQLADNAVGTVEIEAGDRCGDCRKDRDRCGDCRKDRGRCGG